MTALSTTIWVGLALAASVTTAGAAAPAAGGALAAAGAVAPSIAAGIAASKVGGLCDAMGVHYQNWCGQGKATDANDWPVAIRRAHLEAIKAVVEDYRKSMAGNPNAQEVATPFARATLEWIKRESKNIELLIRTFKSEADSTLPSVKQVLGEENADLRQLAETGAIEQLRRLDGKPDFPSGFEDAFNDAQTGWYMRYTAIIVEVLKHNSPLRAVWQEVRQAAFDIKIDNVVELVTELQSTIQTLHDASFGKPPVFTYIPSDLPPSAETRFSFRNPSIPFTARENELATLTDFLEDDAAFSWMTVTGGGGAGKSKLLLEFCRHHTVGWKAGFILGQRQSYNFSSDRAESWKPVLPHLFVIDYAIAESEIARGLMGYLARAATLPQKTRVILIERADDAYLNQTVIGHTSQADISRHRFKPCTNLTLSALTSVNIFNLVKAFLPAQTTMDAESFSATHRAIDPDERVLSALLLSDSLARGESPQTLSALMSSVLVREHQYMTTEVGLTEDIDIPILVLATIANGFDARKHSVLLPDTFKKKGKPQFEALALFAPATGFESQPDHREAIGRYLPDIVGEFFALESLKVDPYLGDKHPWIVTVARDKDGGIGFLDFISRAERDFPDHETTLRIGSVSDPKNKNEFKITSSYNSNINQWRTSYGQ
ncbi:MAG: ATP-binding protein [Ahrensia sp.]